VAVARRREPVLLVDERGHVLATSPSVPPGLRVDDLVVPVDPTDWRRLRSDPDATATHVDHARDWTLRAREAPRPWPVGPRRWLVTPEAAASGAGCREAWWLEATSPLLHKIKNTLQPLRNVETMVRLAETGSTENLETWLRDASASVDRIVHLATAFSERRREHLAHPITRSVVDVGAAVRQTMDLLQPAWEGRIAGRLDAPASPSRALADPRLLGQVVQEILANATDAVGESGEIGVALGSSDTGRTATAPAGGSRASARVR